MTTMAIISEKEAPAADVQSRKHTISLLVENKFGAFNRIAGLFSAKGVQHRQPHRRSDRRRFRVPDDDRDARR